MAVPGALPQAVRSANSPRGSVAISCHRVSRSSRVRRGICLTRRGHPWMVVRAAGDSGQEKPTENTEAASPVISEDVLERLRKAEAEASALREQLQAAQGTAELSPEPEKPKRRIDSADFRRETLFSKDAADNWLRESEAVDLLVGRGVGESGTGITEEGEEIVKRRLIIGTIATVGLGAFALVPTEYLRPKPQKPLFFYLTPVLRVQAQLEGLKELVAEGQFEQIKPVLSQMLGSPGDIKSNLENSVAWLDDTKQREKANALAFDFLEYLQEIDYSKYFENMRTAQLTGADRARFADFSTKCLAAAQGKLAEFLKLMPEEDLEAARSQANTTYF